MISTDKKPCLKRRNFSSRNRKTTITLFASGENYKNLLSSISQTKSSINDLKRNNQTTQINENKENTNLETNVLQAFYQLKKRLKIGN